MTVFGGALAPKRLQLLSELVPEVRAVAVLINPTNPLTPPNWKLPTALEEAALANRLELRKVTAGSESELDSAFASLAQQNVNALLLIADAFFFVWRQQIAALALRYSIPAIYEAHEFVEAGGLASYGPATGLHRETGSYVGKILKGAKPADLPVQQPTKFKLVINLKTAKALGLTVPQSLFALADEVIE
jgi:putative ABC transport system substrate-binding protein